MGSPETPKKTSENKPENGKGIFEFAKERLASIMPTPEQILQNIHDREGLYRLGGFGLRKIFVPDFKETNTRSTGTFNFRDNTDFEEWIGLKHVIPDGYDMIKVIRKGTIPREGTRKNNGSFYDNETGAYIDVKHGDSFIASRSSLESKKYKEKIAELPAQPEIPLNQTLFIGDSLTVGMNSFGKLEENGAHVIAKEGRQTGAMLEEFKDFLANVQARKIPKPKRVIILGGVNDVVSGVNLNKTKRNLEKIYSLARENGISVTACTQYRLNTEVFLQNYESRRNRKYPFSAAELDARIDDLNDWIRAQTNVDKIVNLDIDIQKAGLSKDGLHPTAATYKKMSALLAV